MVAVAVDSVEVFDLTVVQLVQDEARRSKRRKNQVKRARRANQWNPFALHRKVERSGGKLVLNSPVSISIPNPEGRNVHAMLNNAGWDDICMKQNSPYIIGTAPVGTTIQLSHGRLHLESPNGVPFCLIPIWRGSRIVWFVPGDLNQKRHSRPRRKSSRRRRQNR